MDLTAYMPVFVQVMLAISMAATILIASHLFGQRAPGNPIKDAPYECGLLAAGSGHPRFAVKFYVTAMLFIIFDIEIIFLVPWATIYVDFLRAQIPILLPALFFILVLAVGLVYELKKGALEWER